MTNQRLFVYGVVLIALLVVAWGVNKYVITPAMAPQLVQVEQLPPMRDTIASMANRSVVAATLSRIRSVKSAGDLPEEFEPRQVERNPFRWPGELSEADRIRAEMAALRLAQERDAASAAEVDAQSLEAAAAMVPEGEPEDIVLSMILVGEHKKLAIINNKFVYEGDRISGGRIAAIEEDAVVLANAAGTTRLTLGRLSWEHLLKETPEAADTTPEPEAEPKPVPTADETSMDAIGAVLRGESAPTAAQEEAVRNLMERLAPLIREQGQ